MPDTLSTVIAGAGLFSGVTAAVVALRRVGPERLQIEVSTMGSIIDALREERERLATEVNALRSEIGILRAENVKLAQRVRVLEHSRKP